VGRSALQGEERCLHRGVRIIPVGRAAYRLEGGQKCSRGAKSVSIPEGVRSVWCRARNVTGGWGVFL